MNAHSHRHEADADGRQPIGFLVEFKLRRGMGPAAQVSFQRRLEDHLAGQELQHGFSQLQGAVWDEHTDLAAEDQADFMCWAIAEPEMVCVEMSQPIPVDGLDDITGPRLRVQVSTPSTLAAALLYGLGGISAEVFIEALGGFVMPHLLD